MVWSWVVIALVGIARSVSGSSIAENGDSERGFAVNSVQLHRDDVVPHFVPTFEKRNTLARIDESDELESTFPESILYRMNKEQRPRLSRLDFPSSSLLGGYQNPAQTSPIVPRKDWQYGNNPLYVYEDKTELGSQEVVNYDGISNLVVKPSNTNIGNAVEESKPLLWKRRIQNMKGRNALLGYSGTRNKGVVLSIDLGIKALRDAIIHAKTQRMNRKIQAQARRNMKMLHTIGKRRAIFSSEEFYRR